jgi:hypothetical protein
MNTPLPYKQTRECGFEVIFHELEPISFLIATPRFKCQVYRNLERKENTY